MGLSSYGIYLLVLNLTYHLWQMKLNTWRYSARPCVIFYLFYNTIVISQELTNLGINNILLVLALRDNLTPKMQRI